MEDTSDIYKTIASPSSGILFKDKKSNFFGYAFPVDTEDEVKKFIEEIKRKHPTANHVCYAWQIGIENQKYRVNDDGEPNNSAGMPIYGQLQSFGVTNILVTIARIFGGTKLGVGGLISAYRTTAQLTLESSKIVERTLKQGFKLSFQYTEMDIVMRTIKQRHLEIVSQKFEMDCEITISIRKMEAQTIKEIFEGIYGVEII